MKHATWKHKNGKTITGTYTYNWAKNAFHIQLNSKTKSGHNEQFYIHNDTPEWNNYKLIKEEQTTQPHENHHEP